MRRTSIPRTGLLPFYLKLYDEILPDIKGGFDGFVKRIAAAINDFIGRHSTDFGMLAAGGLIAALPPVIIAFICQHYIVSGLTAGSVKG